MILPRNLKMLFRTISAIVAGIFLFQQISWAGDLANWATDTINRQDAEQTQTFAPAYLQNQQALHQDLVNLNQDIEDYQSQLSSSLAEGSEPAAENADDDKVSLKGPMGSGETGGLVSMDASGEGSPIQSLPGLDEGALLSVTTSAGDIIHYKADGKIDYIETINDPVIQLIRNLDIQNGELIGATVEYRDSTIQEIRQSRTFSVTMPDGTVLYYGEGERVTFVMYQDGALSVYTYPADNSGDITVADFVQGSYSGTIETGFSFNSPPKKTSYYDSEGKLKNVIFATGREVVYNSGILSAAEDDDGTIYEYEEIGTGEGDEAEYNVSLNSITKGNIKYLLVNNNISAIQLSDRMIRNFELNEVGELISGTIEYADDVKVTVKDREITGIIDALGVETSYSYAEDGLSCDVTIDDHGNVRRFKYLKDPASGKFSIEANGGVYEYDASWKFEDFKIDNGIFTHNYDENGVYTGSVFRMKDEVIKLYDNNRVLSETTLPDGTIYTYYDSGSFAGMLKEAALPDGHT
ncbi:MAG: hypothetical protein WC592_01605, partial [Candidatus Omnitrophota bacterium]